MGKTEEIILRKLRYEPKTGKLFWKKIEEVTPIDKKYNTQFANKEAGSYQKSSGYIVVQVDGKSYKAHRLAWFLYYGVWPSLTLDHKNLIKTDNRIENLREFDQGQQARNKPISRSNTSGCVGVHFCKSRKKWVARIHENGKRHWLGYFESKQDAQNARVLAQSSKDFYESHGKGIPND